MYVHSKDSQIDLHTFIVIILIDKYNSNIVKCLIGQTNNYKLKFYLKNLLKYINNSPLITTMQRSEKTFKPSPSIHNIIIEDQQAKLNNQIKQYFKSQPYPTFPLTQLLSLPQYSSDQRFYCLVRQLQDWNRRVQSSNVSPDSRAELYRNKFIYTQLKNLTFRGAKTNEGYEANMSKLYDWWRKNSRQQMPMFLTTRKCQKQDDDWQVRRTFKSNMPLELKNYERRALFASHENLHYFQSPKTKELCDDKLVDYLAVKQFNSKQIKLRQAREQQQIQNGKTLLKSQKCRFLEDNCHNLQLYHGNFNRSAKTTLMFRKTHKPAGMTVNRQKNLSSFSLLQKEKEEIQKIKKYRFNSALNKKRNLLPQQAPQTNKTSKTFTTKKPADATISDLGLGTALLTTRKQPLLRQQVSLGGDQLLRDSASQKQDKQNIMVLDFAEFVQLGNWDGQRLISNPFDKKKPLKKGKKKSS